MLRASILSLGLMLAGCVPMAAPERPVSTANLISSSGAVLGSVRVFGQPTAQFIPIRISRMMVQAGRIRNRERNTTSLPMQTA